MGNIYADFDNKGNLLGFYDDHIHSIIPETAKVISNTVHKEFIKQQGKVKINFKTLELECLTLNKKEIEEQNQLYINAESRQFLVQTDWKVIRHQDQLALNINTSLTNKEYLQLLQQRQEARERVVEVL